MRLEDQLSVGEQILWRGKKAVAVSVLESIFNPFLIFALIWLLVDLSFIGMAGAFMLMGDSMGLFILGFFAIHLMPVWIYLGGVITSAIKAKNTEYMITNKGIYVRSGLFTRHDGKAESAQWRGFIQYKSRYETFY